MSERVLKLKAEKWAGLVKCLRQDLLREIKSDKNEGNEVKCDE